MHPEGVKDWGDGEESRDVGLVKGRCRGMLGGFSESFISFFSLEWTFRCGSSIACKAFAPMRMDVFRDSLRFWVQVGVQRIGQLPRRHVASDVLDDQSGDGQIGVGLDVVQSSDSRPVELVGGGFEHAVGTFDRGTLSEELFP